VITDLSMLNLFFSASPVVQGILILLVGVSLLSWTLILQRSFFFRATKRQYQQFEQKYELGQDLNKLYDHLLEKRSQLSGIETIFKAGFREFIRFAKRERLTPQIVMDHTERAMRVALAKEEQRLDQHLPFLATVGSLSVYVGLFGTVWGIMNAFRSLGTTQQATLAMVAPGISEALIATALGLVAAIPAVFAYNRAMQQVQTLMRNYDNLAEEFSSTLYRQLVMQESTGQGIKEPTNMPLGRKLSPEYQG
jgi:biopolymer transport protein TolQ